jgi:hypothetical protein
MADNAAEAAQKQGGNAETARENATKLRVRSSKGKITEGGEGETKGGPSKQKRLEEAEADKAREKDKKKVAAEEKDLAKQ